MKANIHSLKYRIKAQASNFIYNMNAGNLCEWNAHQSCHYNIFQSEISYFNQKFCLIRISNLYSEIIKVGRQPDCHAKTKPESIQYWKISSNLLCKYENIRYGENPVSIHVREKSRTLFLMSFYMSSFMHIDTYTMWTARFTCNSVLQ